DLVLVHSQEPEAHEPAVRTLQPVLVPDLEREVGRQPVPGQPAHQLLPPLAIGVRRRDRELARLPGAHAADAILQGGKELSGADHHGERSAVAGGVEQRPVGQVHGVLEGHHHAVAHLRDAAHPASPATSRASSASSPLEPPLVTTRRPSWSPSSSRPWTTSGPSRRSIVMRGCPSPPRTRNAVSPPTSTNPRALVMARAPQVTARSMSALARSVPGTTVSGVARATAK